MPLLRLGGVAALTILAGLVTASPASAQTACQAPKEPGWRSCLTVSHRAVEDAPDLLLTKARPRLVERLANCPAKRVSRRVVVRTSDGERLGAGTVESRCLRGVARWDALVELDVTVPRGTVIRSYWSGVADGERTAPRVKLG